TTVRMTRLKQATLTFGKPASSTANVNNAPGTSDRPRPRLNINMAELIEGVYDEAIDKFKNHWSTHFPWLIITKTTTGFPAFKCTVCAAFAGDAGKCGRRGRGATDLQTQSFRKDAGTTKHKLAVERQKFEEECGGRQPQIDQHRATVDSEKMRTVALLDSLLFISRSDAPMGMWVKLVRYLSEKGVQGFPKRGYGTYYTTGKHLILFITFVRDFKVVTEFMALLTVEKADAASLLGVLLSHLLAVGVDLQCIAGISTDGANVMMGCKGGLTTRLRVRIPHLVSSHCIAHREALAAKTAAENIPAFDVIDTVIRAVAEHLGRSGPWHQRFMGLHEVFTSKSLELQGIHAVRWLSRGDAVLRLVAVLPALIVMLKEWDATLYALVMSYRFHFLLVHAQIKRTTSHIESRYVDCGDDFGGGVSELLSPFIACHGPGGNREVKVEGIDSDGRPARFKFVLHEDELEEFEGLGTHDDCVEVCTEFVKVIVLQLEHRLGDLNGMSGARLFTPDEYPLERGERNRSGASAAPPSITAALTASPSAPRLPQPPPLRPPTASPLPPAASPPPSTVPLKRMAYFVNWANMDPSLIPAAKLTHVFYAFASINPTTYKVATALRRAVLPCALFSVPSAAAPGLPIPFAALALSLPNIPSLLSLLSQVVPNTAVDVTGGLYQRFNTTLKTANPTIKTLLSIGGASANTTVFSNAASSAATRSAFIQSAIALTRTYFFDGLDIDWEYPIGKAALFSALVTDFRAAIESEAASSGKPKLLLTAAVAPDEARIIQSYNVTTTNKMLDFVNIMTYDLHGSWEAKTGMHFPSAGPELEAERQCFHGCLGVSRLGPKQGHCRLGDVRPNLDFKLDKHWGWSFGQWGWSERVHQSG
ncbi:unnamed protein product, partial [Closterium sp. NIES-53]